MSLEQLACSWIITFIGKAFELALETTFRSIARESEMWITVIAISEEGIWMKVTITVNFYFMYTDAYQELTFKAQTCDMNVMDSLPLTGALAIRPIPDVADIKSQLERILQSESFVRSPQLSRLLRYCIEQTLVGCQDNLKEQLLGSEVFRRPHFDPRVDPIVRVEVRRLRTKLDEYYRNAGVNDPIRIEFQRGGYVPRFIGLWTSTTSRKPHKQASIVVVEDEAIVAHDLTNRLRLLGYRVLASEASGESALYAVECLQPDLVLMDIVLAGLLRGTDVARQIWTRWHIPVVYLTAFSDSVVLEEIKGTEPFGFILKPFEPKLVDAVVQLALSRHAKLMADTTDS